jgi:O-antigen ligase
VTAAVSRKPSRVTDFFFFATLFTITFAKVQWEVAGTLSLSDVLTAFFLLAFTADLLSRGQRRFTRGAVVVAGFFLLFLLVYLVGFFNLDTEPALAQWAKGMVKFLLHFLFLVAGVVYVIRRTERFYWKTLAAFMLGIAANAVYGIVQLAAAEVADVNLDQSLLAPITGGASSINVYGAIEGRSVYRPNALTGDPNHLGIELILPLLVLTPLYLRLERGHRLRVPLALLLSFLLLIELATLSRSGLLGLGAGLAVLALPYRRKLRSGALWLPLAGVAALIGAFVASQWDFFETVLRSRISTEGGGSSTHFQVYTFVPDVLSQHPLFGLGLNNFSVYYEFVTGRTNFGPHSFYVATIVETGIVGTLLFAGFLVYLFRRLGRMRELGRRLAAAGDRTSARVRPLAWGLTAALVGTIASNAFYLTMSFYYFFALALLVLSAPIVFARRL